MISALVTVLNKNISAAGPLFIVFFVALAIGFRGYASLKGFAYTVTIFAAVTTALFYPAYFYGVDRKLTGVQIGFMSDPSDRFRTLKDWRYVEQ